RAAHAAFDRALAIRRKVLGEEHPETAQVLTDLGDLLVHEGRAAEALPLIERGLAAEKNAYGPRNSDVVEALRAYGSALVATGQPAKARGVLEPALATALDDHLGAQLVAGLRFTLAKARVEAGGDAQHACALAGKARAAAAALPYAEDLPEMERWLKRRRCP